MALRPQVLSGYRGLLRAIGTVFRGDEIALAHCRRTARAAVMSNATEADAAKLAGMVKELGEATEFLTMNVAQAKLNDAGRYELHLEAKHAEKSSGNIQVQTPAEAVTKGKHDGCACC